MSRAETRSSRCPSREALRRFLDAEHIEGDLLAVEAHIEECERCLAALEHLARENADAALVEGWIGDMRSAWREREALFGARGGLVAGRYRVQRELGRGGQSVVYLAEDESLGRPVALKVLSAFGSAFEARRERLRREAEVISRLDHPGLCLIYEARLDAEPAFLAMRFVPGRTLADRLARRRREVAEGRPVSEDGGPSFPAFPEDALQLGRCLRFVEEAARALHVAHEAGVVHRDVKPGNLLVTPELEPVWVDFGLARDELAGGSSLTGTGDLLGTVGYMSPEQIGGSARELDRRSDLYSLGVVLYECLTLRRPFEEEGALELLHAQRTRSVPSAGRFNPHIPRDLEVVLENALAPERSRRYATAEEFAEDLRRVREAQPIAARSASAITRLRRWGRRHPLLASVGSTSFVLLAAALAVTLHLLGQTREALAASTGAALRERSSHALAKDPAIGLSLALAAWERDPGYASTQAVLAALELCWVFDRIVLPSRPLIVRGSPRGELVAVACVEGEVLVRSLEDGRDVARFEGAGAEPTALEFVSEGPRLLLGDEAGRVHLLDPAHPEGPRVLLEGGGRVLALAPLADGGVLSIAEDGISLRPGEAGPVRRLASDGGKVVRAVRCGSTLALARLASREGAEAEGAHVELWDVATLTGRSVGELAGEVLSLAVDPNARWVAAGTAEGEVRWWRGLATARPGGRPEEAPAGVGPAGGALEGGLSGLGRVAALAASPRGERLAVAAEGAALLVPMLEEGEPLRLEEHGRRQVSGLAFDPRGERLATVAFDGRLRCFDVATGRLDRGPLPLGFPYPFSVVWSPEGGWLAVVGSPAELPLLYGDRRPFLATLRGHTDEVLEARFCGGGERVVTISRDGTARGWDGRDGAPEWVSERLESPPTELAVVPGSEALLVGTEDGRVLRLDGARGTFGAELARHRGAVRTLAVDPTGRRYVSGDEEGSVCWAPLSGVAGRTLQLEGGSLTALAFGPRGERVAVGTDRRTLALFEWEDAGGGAQGGRPLAPRWTWNFDSDIPSHDSVLAACFVEGGGRIAAAAESMRLVLLAAGDGRVLSERPFPMTVGHFVPLDGGVLVAGSHWQGGLWAGRLPGFTPLGVWEKGLDPRQAQLLPTSRLTALVRVPGRPWVALASLDGSASLWDVPAARCLATYRGHDDAVWSIDASPDGRMLVTASADHTARLLPTDPVATARRHLPPLAGRQDPLLASIER